MSFRKFFYSIVLLLCISNLVWANGSDTSFPLFTDDPIQGNTVWTPSPVVVWHELEQNYYGKEMVLAGESNTYERIRKSIVGKNIYPCGSFDMQVQCRTLSSGHTGWNDWSEEIVPVEIKTEGHLQINASYDQPFAPLPANFINSDGITNHLYGFGIFNEKDEGIRDQAEILFYDSRENFAVSLKTTDPSNMLVVAMLEDIPDSLKGGFTYVESRVEEEVPVSFRLEDKLIIPNLELRQKHHYIELEGESVTIGSRHSFLIDEASLDIAMRLTRFGVELESVYGFTHLVGVRSEPPKHCFFNSPFLLYMKKQDSELPYFILWVDDVKNL